jgi:hypothetical protein
MPRRSASIHEKKIPSMPVISQNPTLPANSQNPTLPVNSQRPSFLQTMKEGLALGVGSSIGHRIVGAAFGEPTLRVGAAFGEPTLRVSAAFGEPTLRVSAASGVPPSSSEEYEQCMKKYDDIAACKRFLAKN